MDRAETVLILTPVKDAGPFLDEYFRSLDSLTYPHHLVSLGFLESDSAAEDEAFGSSGSGLTIRHSASRAKRIPLPTLIG